MRNKSRIVFVVYLVFAILFSWLVGDYNSYYGQWNTTSIFSALITFVALSIFGIIVYRMKSQLKLVFKPLIGRLLSIIQAHRLIFAIAFTFLLFVWFIHPRWLGGVPDELGWFVITVIWTIVMIWLFHKRQSS